MKVILFITIFVFSSILFLNGIWQNNCFFAQSSDSTPKRLVIIKGKAIIINHPDSKDSKGIPATSETLIFQKDGCQSCFVGANVDIDGNYKILVSDGKYKIIVRNPSDPEIDLLAPDQERFIYTGSENSPNSVFNFDIKIKLPD